MSSSRKPASAQISRRSFLKESAVAAGVAIVPASVFGANPPSERITMGCIGVGNMGSSDLRAFKGNPGAQVVAVCEVDAQRLEAAGKLAGVDAKSCYGDFRELLARPDIDAVTVVTRSSKAASWLTR